MVIGELVYSKSTRRHCAKQLPRHFCSVSMNVQSIRLRQSLPTTSRTSVPPWNVQYTVPSLVGILLGRRPSHNELNALPQRQLLWAGVKNIYIYTERDDVWATPPATGGGLGPELGLRPGILGILGIRSALGQRKPPGQGAPEARTARGRAPQRGGGMGVSSSHGVP